MKRLIIYLSLLALCITSCEGFFTLYPGNSVTEANFYQTEEDFNQAVRGCYARLKSNMSFHLTSLAYRSDECIQVAMATSNQNQWDFDHFVENSSCAIMSDIWNAWYSGIYRCNDVLNHIEGKEFSKVAQYKAEAMFIRSWFYFNLYRCFGGVPLTTVVVSPEEALTVPRCTEEQMLSRLESDLIFCIENLPLSRGLEVARVTKIAAQALLGKVYLTFGKYAEAEKVLAEAMEDPFYGLMPTTGDAFKVENKMNKEIIFALYYNKTNDNGHGFWWDSTSEAKDRTNPTQNLRDLYESNDNRLPLIRDWKKLEQSDAYSDNRYVLTKWYDNYDMTFIEQVGNDFPHLRYADVILMRAEALARQDKIGEALEYMNITRTRAGLDALSSSKISGKDTFIKELANERGREFALEGQRWFDLVRLGLAVEHFQRLDVEYKGQTISYANITKKNLLFPIPNDQIEIVNNPQILWQNPGFE